MSHLICEVFRLQAIPASLKLPESMVSLLSLCLSPPSLPLLISEDALEAQGAQGNLKRRERDHLKQGGDMKTIQNLIWNC